MHLVTYNIQYGKGRDGRFDLDRIAGEVRGADVIALQEVERHWPRSGLADQPALLAERLPDYHWVYGAGVDMDASEVAADGTVRQRRRQFGNMLLSRTPILSTRTHVLPKDAALGAALSLQRVALEAVLASPRGRLLRVYSVHLTHLSAGGRMPQIEALLGVHARACADGAAITGVGLPAEWGGAGVPPPMPREALLMGDFNCEPDSAEYERLVGPLSAWGDRLSALDGFADAWTLAGHEAALPPTSDIRGRPARLDYVLLSSALAGSVRGARTDESATGSDHLPVWVELDV